MLDASRRLSSLFFISLLISSPVRADDLADAALSMCEKMKACAIAQIPEKDLTPEVLQILEDTTITINTFFGWDFISCESLLKDGTWHPIVFTDPYPYAQVTSLHYHFLWMLRAMLRLSELYRTGLGVEEDTEIAREWKEKATAELKAKLE